MAMKESTPLPSAFAALYEQMPRCVRRVVCDGAEPESVSLDELHKELHIPQHVVSALKNAKVLRKRAMISSAECSALRDAIDCEGSSTRADTVDGAAEHQLNLSVERLSALVGDETARALCRLPAEFRAAGSWSERQPREVFVRRYSGGTRPWIPFHADRADVTVNVALTSDQARPAADTASASASAFLSYCPSHPHDKACVRHIAVACGRILAGA